MPKYVEDQEVAKHYKKAKKRNKKSDHKHNYVDGNYLVPTPWNFGSKDLIPIVITYCDICGKIYNFKRPSFGRKEIPAREDCTLFEDFKMFKTSHMPLELRNE